MKSPNAIWGFSNGIWGVNTLKPPQIPNGEKLGFGEWKINTLKPPQTPNGPYAMPRYR